MKNFTDRDIINDWKVVKREVTKDLSAYEYIIFSDLLNSQQSKFYHAFKNTKNEQHTVAAYQLLVYLLPKVLKGIFAPRIIGIKTLQSPMSEVRFDICDQFDTVITEVEKCVLATGWTSEAKEDFLTGGPFALDAHAQLVTVLADDIITELNARVMDKIVPLALNNNLRTHGKSSRVVINNAVNDVTMQINILKGTHECDSADIFLIASPMMVSLLQTTSIDDFIAAPKGSFHGPDNTCLVGYYKSVAVYSYLFVRADYTSSDNEVVIIGYKGNREEKSGIQLCLYDGLDTVNNEKGGANVSLRYSLAESKDSNRCYRAVTVNIGNLF